jgi:hypothetical protein
MHALKQVCRKFNGRKPEVLVVVHEMDPRAGMLAAAASGRAPPNPGLAAGRGSSEHNLSSRKKLAVSPVPPGLLKSMRKRNPREAPSEDRDMSYG